MTAEERLSGEKLSKRISGAAFNVARDFNCLDSREDVEQEIILAILERYAAEPTFLDQTDAYIVNHGAWKARDSLRRMAAQQWNHEVEDDDTDTGTPLLDLVGEYNPWGEVETEAAIAAAYKQMDETDQGIVEGLLIGLTRREIGERVGLSHTHVNNHIPGIAAAIRAQM